MASWDAVAEKLLRTASNVDADVQFRSLVLQQQCENLQAICQYMYDLQTSVIEEKNTEQAETLAVGQSIQDAIRRARRIRETLATTDNINGDDNDGEPSDAGDQQLQSILAVAEATRTAQQSLEAKPEAVPKVRLEYPRKLRALEMQLEELRLKEKDTPMQHVFCCKMSEHLSLTPQRRQQIADQQQKHGAAGKMDAPVLRIQTSFPKQVARLRGGYQLLLEFVLEKIDVESPKSQQVANAPTLSSVFPIYHRLKQAKKMLRLLNSEAIALLERVPPSPPKLSSAASEHRDAMLARIRRKRPQPHVGVIDNETLQAAARAPDSHLHADTDLFEKLQAAWTARPRQTLDSIQDPFTADMYSTTAREIVLTELSNAVLWSFKTHFSDTNEQPDTLQVEAVMRLIRLVDSIALSQGRTYRSIVPNTIPGS
ncbi:hypothetical protein P3T76_000837 [Phytophthora citrophthora]|uniref:Uncharacterized protein n=1 Tax=Phytophthora citrophthora TaxID=4793 RepID=A0AAD9LT45_9STRA|nr:hypothetical protein P3T76_000837 [Phytophthora citrophthora]